MSGSGWKQNDRWERDSFTSGIRRTRADRELEVLTNETNAFSAELGLATAQLNELLELVNIYKNLGGGWEV